MASACLAAGEAHAAGVLPSGGLYVSGNGAISGARNALIVKQSSTTGIIDWNSFSFGKSQSVTFDNGSGATLNEVTGGGPSIVAGVLHASGSVYLIDPSGVIISASGRIVTGGSFVVSTQDSTGAQRGNILDAGTIRAARGSVHLSAANVSVPGTIAVMRGGHLWLTSSGTTSISGALTAHNTDGAGGTVTVRGNDIAMSGTIDASASEKDRNGGTVSLVARSRDTVSGTIDAAGARGGFVETSGHALSIGGARVDAGSGGRWLLDPYDLTINSAAASTIDTALDAGTSVLLETTVVGTTGPGTPNPSGNGDIFIDSAIGWSTSATLSLNAYRNIDINADITVSGRGSLQLTTGTGTSGNLTVASGRNVSFTGGASSGASLSIDGTPYTLVYDMGEMQAINASNTALDGDYALAVSINAATDSTMPASWVPIGTNGHGVAANSSNGFAGTFEGLGNTISNLTIDLPTLQEVGLFGYSSGTIQDIGLIGGSDTGFDLVGALVGYNAAGGSISNVYATGWVSGISGFGIVGCEGGCIGGLVGENFGAINNTHATGVISGYAELGGLVGQNYGTISNSYATGVVSGEAEGEEVGGLVGNNAGTITNAYATGAVSGGAYSYETGGLAGANDSGDVISNSHATGAVSGGANSTEIGGLVGDNAGTISQSFANGAVGGGASATDIGGLVGYNFGTISNTYAAGAVSAGMEGDKVGGLAGFSQGTISESYANGAVGGGTNAKYIGGLVGFNTATIAYAYATGAVSTGANGGYVGGLAGYSQGTISDSFAMGAVSGGDNTESIGGLVGYDANVGNNGGTISSSYATGAVGAGSGSLEIGGVVGTNDNAVLTNLYWDTQTSGQNSGLGFDNNNQSGNVAGLTTAQLQGALPSGLAVAAWGTGSGLFPYLLWPYASGTPQAISGLAYSNGGVTLLTSTSTNAVTVSALVNGDALGSATTGANGYYYILVAPGTLSGSQQLLTYLNGDAVNANTYVQSPSGNVSNANLYGGYLRMFSGAGTSAAVFSGLSTALGSNTGSNFLYAGGNLAAGSTLDIESSNSSGLAINAALDAGSGTIILNAAGPVTQTAAISAADLELLGANVSYTLTDAANSVGTLAAHTGTIDLADDATLMVGTVGSSAGAAASGNLTLTTTGSNDNIAIQAALTGVTVDLVSAGTIANTTGAGIVTAAGLKGSSMGKISLDAANQIAALGAFTTGGKAFSLKDAEALAVNGAINSGAGNLTLTTTGANDDLALQQAISGATVDLVSAGTITSTRNGVITATTLEGSSVGTTALNAANMIGVLGAFTTSNGAFSLTDAQSLAVDGAVNSGTGNLTLTTTGTNDNLAIQAALTGATVDLISAALITSSSGEDITATALTGSSAGRTTLSATNAIGVLGAFTTNDGAFSLTDSEALAVNGAVDAGTGDLTLTTTGTNNLAIQATITGGTVDLTSGIYTSKNLTTGGAVLESSGGAVIATKILNVSADTGIDLDSTSNDITSLGTDQTNGTNVVTKN